MATPLPPPPYAFGMREPNPREHAERMASARMVGRMLREGGIPEAEGGALDALSVCKGIFNRVVRQDQPDWVVTQVRLGYPDPSRCRAIAESLAACRSAVRDGDAEAWREARARTRIQRARKALLAYRGRRFLPDEPGAGFVFVMSRREEPDLLSVGFAEGALLDGAAAANAARPNRPLGVRGFWRTTDVAAAEAAIRSMRAGTAPNGTLEVRGSRFGPVAARIGRRLAEEGLLRDPFLDLRRLEES